MLNIRYTLLTLLYVSLTVPAHKLDMSIFDDSCYQPSDSSHLAKQFRQVAIEGDLARMRELISHADTNKDNIAFKMNDNSICFYNYAYHKSPLATAFRIAARKGDAAMIELLIQSGANVNDTWGCDQPHAGRTILVEAIESGSEQAVKMLLEHDARVEDFSELPVEFNRLEPKERNFMMLPYAIMIEAPIEIIELLIKYSKDLNKPTYYGDWTPYAIAAQYKNTQAMAALANAGANITI
jgi:ankyrin repeat protein